MAYVGHSPVREFRNFHGVATLGGHRSAFAKSAVIAIAAAAAIMALSDIGGGATETFAMAKADRVAPPSAVAAVIGDGFSVDAVSRTTTVERGATTPLSTDSPFRAGR